MMKKSFFPLLSVLFLCGCRTADESITLATFNIRCPVDKTPHTWNERKPRCLAVIKQNRFDIFGVQEAIRFQLDDLVGNEYQFIGGGRDDFAQGSAPVGGASDVDGTVEQIKNYCKAVLKG